MKVRHLAHREAAKVGTVEEVRTDYGERLVASGFAQRVDDDAPAHDGRSAVPATDAASTAPPATNEPLPANPDEIAGAPDDLPTATTSGRRRRPPRPVDAGAADYPGAASDAVAGEQVAGDSVAGEQVAGDSAAGEVSGAGEPAAGEVPGA